METYSSFSTFAFASFCSFPPKTMTFHGDVSSSFLVAMTFLWSIHSVASFGAPSSVDRNCQDIRTLKQDIFWIGMLKTRFILITSTYAVYDLSTGELDNTGHKLYLSNPRQLADIYPVLWKKMNEDSTGFMKGNTMRLTVIDEKSEYLYSESQFRKRGNVYDLNSKALYDYKVKDEMKNDKDPLFVMSSNEALYFYGFYFSSRDDPSGRIVKGRFLDKSSLLDSTIVQFVGQELYICQVGQTSDQISLETEECRGDVAIINSKAGFVDSYNFYIMATNRTVAVFSKSAYDRPGTPVRVYLIRYEDFFICGGNPMMMYIIIGVVLFLLICCCCFCFACLFARKKGRGALLNQSTQPMMKKSRSKSRSHSHSHNHKRKKRGRSKSTKRKKRSASSRAGRR